jgi:hypothetical protein
VKPVEPTCQKARFWRDNIRAEAILHIYGGATEKGVQKRSAFPRNRICRWPARKKFCIDSKKGWRECERQTGSSQPGKKP